MIISLNIFSPSFDNKMWINIYCPHLVPDNHLQVNTWIVVFVFCLFCVLTASRFIRNSVGQKLAGATTSHMKWLWQRPYILKCNWIESNQYETEWNWIVWRYSIATNMQLIANFDCGLMFGHLSDPNQHHIFQ